MRKKIHSLPVFYSFFIVLSFFITESTWSQINGTVTNAAGEPLPSVNIYVKGTYTGTTSNEEGKYELPVETSGNYVLVFQYLGFKTEIQEVSVRSFPYVLDVKMREETVTLGEVVVNAKDNPADRVIRQVIANRKKNLEKIKKFTSDFYSRGIYRLKNAPEKILGQDLGDFGGGLDSTRSGIIYLSETRSKLFYEKPDRFREEIVASKVSGDENAFSFNNASDVNFTFYENTIDFNTNLISPIADYAFNYYRYLLEGTFYDDRNNLIYKIKVTPKRPKDRVGEGFLYIVDDDWALYGVEFRLTGEQAQLPVIEYITFKQNFSYSEKDKLWVLRSQTFDVAFSFFGIEGDGRFIAVYSNYDFDPPFDKNTFSSEIVSFVKDANKKEDDFWSSIRPVPLTDEEVNDYLVKDSIQVVRKSKKYLDSLDRKNNRFTPGNFFFGYTYKNSYKDWSLSFNAPIWATQYNSIQGWHTTAGLSFFKENEEKGSWLRVNTDVNYGFSDQRLRANGSVSYLFNRFSRPYLSLSGGVDVEQFNPQEPITPIANSVATLAFNDNFLKAYEKTFVALDYSQDIFNGFRLFGSFAFEDRKPLFNTIDNSEFTSNNPLLPEDFTTPAFEEHQIFKARVTARIRFGQKYLSYPDARYNIPSDKFPTLYVTYEGGFGASENDFNFSQIRARATQTFDVSNKGRFGYNLKAGVFLDADAITFVDFQHFNGNETFIGTTPTYLNTFNLLPYYAQSTNEAYFEGHVEHNFKGYILGKVPLLNALNFNLVTGASLLATENFTPYKEFYVGIDNIGWGKFRFLRFDYVRSYQNGFREDGFIIGLKIFNLFDN